MNNQKILWIIFSVTLFLLVVVVAGFMWFLPSDEEEPLGDIAEADIVAETGDKESVDPIQWVREREAMPGISEEEQESEKDNDLLLVIGESDEDEEADDGETAAEEKTPDDTETVRVAESRSSKPDSRESERRVVSARNETPAPEPAPEPEPKRVRVTQYWIQVGSYSSRSRAEETRRTLSEKGWSSRLTSAEVEGKTYFRVRIGPYTSRDEAGKFLGWLKELSSFSKSYISEVYTTRTVN